MHLIPAGLVQSILAAAVARVGKNVLHIDRNGYYGELWASLMHRELKSLIESIASPQLSETQSSPTSSTSLADEYAIVINSTTPTDISNMIETVHGHSDQGQPLEDNNDQGQPPEDNDNQRQPPEDDVNQGQPLEDDDNRNPALEDNNDQGSPPEGDEDPGRSVASILSWQSLESMWRRFSYDLIPKVSTVRS